jgi:hypothetical protein
LSTGAATLVNLPKHVISVPFNNIHPLVSYPLMHVLVFIADELNRICDVKLRVDAYSKSTGFVQISFFAALAFLQYMEISVQVNAN